MGNRELVDRLRRLGPEQVLEGWELCPACDSLSPVLSFRRGTDGTIEECVIHCSLCHDAGTVSVEAADRWRREMAERRGQAQR